MTVICCKYVCLFCRIYVCPFCFKHVCLFCYKCVCLSLCEHFVCLAFFNNFARLCLSVHREERNLYNIKHATYTSLIVEDDRCDTSNRVFVSAERNVRTKLLKYSVIISCILFCIKRAVQRKMYDGIVAVCQYNLFSADGYVECS